jgi:hypothetical protein
MKRQLAVLASGTALLAGLAALVAMPACGPQLPMALPEDAGNESFARQAVPLLYGRKVKGYDEVKLLSDLATLLDRDKVMRAMMQQPEYVDHWAEVMVDALKVHREGFQAQISCYGDPLRGGADSADLAEWIRTHAPASAAPGGAFNMSDVLRSSLTLDNLYPVYAGHLFAMESRPIIHDDEQAKRHSLGATFGEVYLHRQMLCLTCHNSEYSLSGQDSGWNRTHPIPGYFERALYAAAEGEPTDDAFAMFRTDVLGSGSAPWGAQGCGIFRTSVNNDPLGITAHFIQDQGMQFTIRGVQSRLKQGYDDLDSNGLQRTLPPEIQTQCDFCAANCTGSALDLEAVANNAPNAATVKTLLTNTVWSTGFKCIDCHGGSAGLTLGTGPDWANDLIAQPSSQQPALMRVNPSDANASYLVRKVDPPTSVSGDWMPRDATCLLAGQRNDIKQWIDGMPSQGACAACSGLDCSGPKNYVAGNEAFAFLTAANAVNRAWSATLGYPLTIANYFPRNGSQRNGLWNLTEYRFIPNDWSVQAVLRGAMNSTLFNRKAPRFSSLENPYVVPLLFDPWTEADPRVPPVSDPGYIAADHPENHFNAMGEAVHRYSARSMLTSIHKGLDWTAPERFPPSGPNAYPNVALVKAIGQYMTDTEPGFQGTDLQSLLFWESVHGACTKPSGVSVDWVDRVMDAVAAFDPNDPGGPLTVQDVVVSTRDWLLGHGGIDTATPVDMTGSEETALAAFFGVALSSPATSLVDLEDKLRGYCGVLTGTPQFLLAGIAPSGLGPKPRLRVCNSEPCTYLQICVSLAPAVNSLLPQGDQLLCGNDSVNIISLPRIPDWEVFCPPGLCGVLDLIPEGCWPELEVLGPVADATVPGGGVVWAAAAGPTGNLNACSIEPPACDPRCERYDCCGGPLPPLEKRRRGLALAWAEGAQVREASGVRILPRGGERLEPLRAGRKLQYGDLLVIAAKDGRLRVKTTRGEIKTPKQGLAPDGFVLMLVSGERALRQREEAEVTRKPPMDRIRRARNSGWARRGEAGRPLTTEEFQRYKYTEEEIGLADLIKRGLLPAAQPAKEEPPKKQD